MFSKRFWAVALLLLALPAGALEIPPSARCAAYLMGRHQDLVSVQGKEVRIKWHHRPLSMLGPQITKVQGKPGVTFQMWLPRAKKVALYTNVDHWQKPHPMIWQKASGLWEVHIPGAGHGTAYRIQVTDSHNDAMFRLDPYAPFIIQDENRNWYSVVWDHAKYQWQHANFKAAYPLRILEVHPGTIIKGRPAANFREIAHYIVEHYPGINYVSLMPIAHHSLAESWGYHVGGYFATDFRHGTPDDLKYLIDYLHGHKIGVGFDLVYGHATSDVDVGLGHLDGTELYFKKGIMGTHPIWGSRLFDYEREEVSNFLLSNFRYLVENFHIDFARLDSTDSMMRLDFGRAPGTWYSDWGQSNVNYGAKRFLQDLNALAHALKPNFFVIAEDSRGEVWHETLLPFAEEGLGFDYAWAIGQAHAWMGFAGARPDERWQHLNLHYLVDKLRYGKSDARGFINYIDSHDTVEFRTLIDILLSQHDAEEDALAVARNIYAHIFLAAPGHPMVFQGAIDAVRGSWQNNYVNAVNQRPLTGPSALSEDLVGPFNQYLGQELPAIFATEPALRNDHLSSAQVLFLDNEQKVIVMVRHGAQKEDDLLIIQNYSWQTYPSFDVPTEFVPGQKVKMILNSDDPIWGGRGTPVQVSAIKNNQRLTIEALPAFSTLVVKAMP